MAQLSEWVEGGVSYSVFSVDISSQGYVLVEEIEIEIEMEMEI